MKSSYKTRIACCAAALLCCAPLMQSCGEQSSEKADKSSSSVSSSSAEQPESSASEPAATEITTTTETEQTTTTEKNYNNNLTRQDKIKGMNLCSQIARNVRLIIDTCSMDFASLEIDLSEMEGVYTFTGDDFKFDQEPSPDSPLLKRFLYRMSVYYPTITDIKQIKVRFSSNYNDTVVVVESYTTFAWDRDKGGIFYGFSQNSPSYEDYIKIESIDQALEYAINGIIEE